MKLVSLFNPVSLPDDPSNPNDGDLYYNTTTGNYRLRLNGLWVSLVHDQNIKISITPEIFIIGSPEVDFASTQLEQFYSENILNCVSASMTTIIIPDEEESSIRVGSRIGIVRGYEGAVEIVKGSEDIDFDPPSDVYLTKPGTEVRLIKIGSNRWIMTGEFPDLY
jgi:hypothetical protein